MRAAVALAAFLSATIAGHAASLWDHNGSVLSLEASGSVRKFIYQNPRSGIPVRTGTVLFTGTKTGNQYLGTAYTFSSVCGALGFSVSGPVSEDQRMVTLYGRAPIPNASCQVAGYRDEVLVFTFQEPSQQKASGFPLVLGRTANGFHIPQQYSGRTIYAGWPTNEHTIFAVEDLMKTIGADIDTLVLETKDNIDNAYAVIDGEGSKARRLIVFDYGWLSRIGAEYRVILAHEVAHHVCKHTLTEFFGAPRDKELEADRAAGAILRKAHDSDIALGGGVVDFSAMVEAVRITLRGPGSSTHPPGDKRLQAFVDGWREGSSCLTAAYVPVNPIPHRDPTLIERIVSRYGNDMTWCFFGPELMKIGPCLPRHPRVRTEITGNDMRIVLVSPNSVPVPGVFPPDYRQIRTGTVLFTGTSDKEKIRGTFWHHKPGCNAVSYAIEGNFVENNGIFLTGQIPHMNGCEVVGSLPITLHFLKNMDDYSLSGR